MEPGNYILYHVEDAEVLPDGVLRVQLGGSLGASLFDGIYDVPPDSPDYEFWLWLRARCKRRWFQLGVIPGLDEQDIAKYRQEYEHETPALRRALSRSGVKK